MIIDTAKRKAELQNLIDHLQESLDQDRIEQCFVVVCGPGGALTSSYVGNWHELALASNTLQAEFSRYYFQYDE